jgi:heat shock protein 5
VQTLVKDLPYEVSSDKDDNPVFQINVGGRKKSYTPEYVTSIILRELKHMANAALGANETVTHAVIGAPKYYNDQRRQAIKDAGKLAGIEVLRIINECTASSIAYGVDKNDGERNIVVFDMGDTLDVSVLLVEEGVFEVLASSHRDIGGKDFDQRIFDQ